MIVKFVSRLILLPFYCPSTTCNYINHDSLWFFTITYDREVFYFIFHDHLWSCYDFPRSPMNVEFKTPRLTHKCWPQKRLRLVSSSKLFFALSWRGEHNKMSTSSSEFFSCPSSLKKLLTTNQLEHKNFRPTANGTSILPFRMIFRRLFSTKQTGQTNNTQQSIESNGRGRQHKNVKCHCVAQNSDFILHFIFDSKTTMTLRHNFLFLHTFSNRKRA